jgi:hypothetical protein
MISDCRPKIIFINTLPRIPIQEALQIFLPSTPAPGWVKKPQAPIRITEQLSGNRYRAESLFAIATGFDVDKLLYTVN